jgi:hypothetical protein
MPDIGASNTRFPTATEPMENAAFDEALEELESGTFCLFFRPQNVCL